MIYLTYVVDGHETCHIYPDITWPSLGSFSFQENICIEYVQLCVFSGDPLTFRWLIRKQFLSFLEVDMVFELQTFCIFIDGSECRVTFLKVSRFNTVMCWRLFSKLLLMLMHVCVWVYMNIYCYQFCKCWEAIMLKVHIWLLVANKFSKCTGNSHEVCNWICFQPYKNLQCKCDVTSAKAYVDEKVTKEWLD